jgi:hypothetical protein
MAHEVEKGLKKSNRAIRFIYRGENFEAKISIVGGQNSYKVYITHTYTPHYSFIAKITYHENHHIDEA